MRHSDILKSSLKKKKSLNTRTVFPLIGLNKESTFLKVDFDKTPEWIQKRLMLCYLTELLNYKAQAFFHVLMRSSVVKPLTEK